MQPPITWQEIRDHLTQRLMLDEEWTLHGEDGMIWQPWLLPVHIQVIEHGQYADGYPFLAVKAWMRVADLPQEPGLACADAGNRACPMATFFHDEDDEQVIASVGVILNGNGRSNLVLFHNAVLAMATVAHQLATQILAGLRPPDLDAAEALLGRRDAPDELLGIYAGDALAVPETALVAPAWRKGAAHRNVGRTGRPRAADRRPGRRPEARHGPADLRAGEWSHSARDSCQGISGHRRQAH